MAAVLLEVVDLHHAPAGRVVGCCIACSRLERQAWPRRLLYGSNIKFARRLTTEPSSAGGHLRTVP